MVVSMIWEDDEGPEADYGVFGDVDCEKHMPLVPSAEFQALAKAHREQIEADYATSRVFNRSMIDLFNRSQK